MKDNDGDAFGDRSGELKHYNVEYGPAAVSTNGMCQSLLNDQYKNRRFYEVDEAF